MKFKIDYKYKWPEPAEMADQFFSQVVEARTFYGTASGGVEFIDDAGESTHLFTGVLKVEAIGE